MPRKVVHARGLALITSALGVAFLGHTLALPISSPAQAATTVTQTSATQTSTTQWPLNDLRVMNYYPAQNSWQNMWLNWQPGVIDQDMGKIAGLKANIVRVIIEVP